MKKMAPIATNGNASKIQFEKEWLRKYSQFPTLNEENTNKENSKLEEVIRRNKERKMR